MLIHVYCKHVYLSPVWWNVLILIRFARYFHWNYHILRVWVNLEGPPSTYMSRSEQCSEEPALHKIYEELRSPDYTMEHRRFTHAEQELDTATTEEAACLGMIPTPESVYCVRNRGWWGAYAEIESASVAWAAAGEYMPGISGHIGVQANHTLAEALEAHSLRVHTTSEQCPLGHCWATAVLAYGEGVPCPVYTYARTYDSQHALTS